MVCFFLLLAQLAASNLLSSSIAGFSCVLSSNVLMEQAVTLRLITGRIPVGVGILQAVLIAHRALFFGLFLHEGEVFRVERKFSDSEGARPVGV